MNWTRAQAQAIEYNENKNILVAAAAGSGKTAVLVERIIRKILDENDPLSVDEILVLTFTNAAAREMKNKIKAAIDKKLKEFPDNKHLRAQASKIAAADISTIHAFAQKIIRNNIHRTDIPADFSLIDDGENELLLSEALDDCLERYYAKMDRLTSFADLTLGHGGIKDDKALRQIILRLYKYSQSLASPEKWLNNSVGLYKRVYDTGTISGTEWEKRFLEAANDILRKALEYYAEVNIIAEREFSEDDKFGAFFSREYEALKALSGCETADEFIKLKNGFKFKTRPRETKDEYIKSVLSEISVFRDKAKAILKEPLLSYGSIHEISERIMLLYPRVRTLKNIVLMLGRRHRRLKLSRGFLDFSDLEHRLIELIMNRDGAPTEFCRTLGNRYKMIFVDEYQDTNNIQDTLFTLLSGGRGNIFMVGDLKQSIYGFRNATPKLFLDKYMSYGKNENGFLSMLSDNFRSRETVVNSVNELFREIMFKNTADIDYSDAESLHCGADYPDADDNNPYKTEIIMTDVLDENSKSSGLAPSNKHEAEARSVAERILDLVYSEKLPIFDRGTGSFRPIDFGDIVILYRGGKERLNAFERTLRDYAIPVLSSGGGFLDSLEVNTVLAFLNIINNPLQDIPLIAVMRSPIFGFTADELSEIRTENRKDSFYRALQKSSSEKAAEFLEILTQLRKDSKHMGIHELIYKICYGLDYMAIVGGMRNGEVRTANLKLLLKTACDYEKRGLRGLFNFVDYLKKVSEKAELKQAKSTGNALSAVSVTTIHKSKGLEYPVVILAGTVTGASDKDAVKYDHDLGIGINYVDTENRIEYPSLPMQLIKYYKDKDSRAEEMRLLYVAMTRAKEKLIISCTNAKASNSSDWKKPIIDSSGRVIRQQIERTSVFRDWLVYGFLRNKNLDKLRDLMETDISGIRINEQSCGIDFKYISMPDEDSEETAAVRTEPQAAIPPKEQESAVEREELEQILSYSYPYTELTKIPLKLSVSEIKNTLRENRNEQEWEYTPRLSGIADRTFHSAAENDAAERGTITHYVLQHINPNKTNSVDEIAAQIKGFVASGTITAKQSESVNINSIFGFYKSPIGKRVRTAHAEGRLEREFKMLFPVKASEIYPDFKDRSHCGADIIVQGIADCLFLEDGELVLIDYKTDRCTADYAAIQAEKYRVQIDYYTRGIQEITGVNVKERILYFLTPGVAVNL